MSGTPKSPKASTTGLYPCWPSTQRSAPQPRSALSTLFCRMYDSQRTGSKIIVPATWLTLTKSTTMTWTKMKWRVTCSPCPIVCKFLTIPPSKIITKLQSLLLRLVIVLAPQDCSQPCKFSHIPHGEFGSNQSSAWKSTSNRFCYNTITHRSTQWYFRKKTSPSEKTISVLASAAMWPTPFSPPSRSLPVKKTKLLSQNFSIFDAHTKKYLPYLWAFFSTEENNCDIAISCLYFWILSVILRSIGSE